MTSARKVGIQVGIVGGLLFFFHALIPNSRSYPFIWPVLAGATAFWLAAPGPSTGRIRRGMLAALVAGAVVGIVGFVGSTITLLVLRRQLNAVADALGPSGPALAASAAELGFLIVAVLSVVATLIGGAVMIPFRRTPTSFPGAPAA